MGSLRDTEELTKVQRQGTRCVFRVLLAKQVLLIVHHGQLI